jgi:four helix bundle protein
MRRRWLWALAAEELSASWGRRHAIVEHFRRASESLVLSIAEGARLMSGPDKARTLDYALGSTLECAACLDIARACPKTICSAHFVASRCRKLCRTVRFLAIFDKVSDKVSPDARCWDKL